jgi:hypothetical protein
LTLQNRVTPQGEIVAVPERGVFMGNRGVLHDGDKRLGRRRWALKAWLICRLEFRGRHRAVMTPRRYTELFFFDEATAIAAGHRPCYECRRDAFHAWRQAWKVAAERDAPPSARVMDDQLHRERVDPKTRAPRRWTAPLGALPNGAFIELDGVAHLVQDGGPRRWSWRGYGPATALASGKSVTVLTPRASVLVLKAGYRPWLHPSAGALYRLGDSDITALGGLGFDR